MKRKLTKEGKEMIGKARIITDVLEQQKRELSRLENYKFFIGCICILFIILCVVALGVYFVERHNKINEPTTSPYIEKFMDKVQKNCGSLFIIPCLNNKNQKCVFKQECVAGGYCKGIYTPLKECLK